MNTENKFLTPIQSEISRILPGIKLISEFEEFIRFSATPRFLRKIKTQRDFAKKFGVNEDTLTDWKKLPGFRERIHQIIIEREQEIISEVIDALREKAQSGNPAAIRLWLQYVGEINSKGKNSKD